MLKRYTILFLLFLFAYSANGQGGVVDTQGNVKQVNYKKGGVAFGNYFQLPQSWSVMSFADSCGRMYFNKAGDKAVYFNDCTLRIKLLSVKDTDYIKSLIQNSSDVQTISVNGDSLSIERGNTIYLGYQDYADSLFDLVYGNFINFLSKTEFDAALDSIVTYSDSTGLFVTPTQLKDSLQHYVTTAKLNDTLTYYFTKTQVNHKIDSVFNVITGDTSLHVTRIGWGLTYDSILRVDSSKVESTHHAGSTYATKSTSLTINGTTQDLSDNRTWNVGTVTTVTAGSGLQKVGGGTDITGTGTLIVDSAIYATQYIVSTKVAKGDSLVPGGYVPFSAVDPTAQSGKYLGSVDGVFGYFTPPTSIGSATSSDNSVMLFPLSGTGSSVDFKFNRGLSYKLSGTDTFTQKLLIQNNAAADTFFGKIAQSSIYPAPTTGTITSIATSTGIIGGTITTSGTLQIDSTVVPKWDDTLSGNRWLVTPKYLSSFGYGTGSVTSITAGTGLSGGTITTSGTISMPNTGTAGTYGGDQKYVQLTTDAQGRVTGVSTGTATISYTNVTGTPDLSVYAPIASPTFTGTVTIPSPFKLGSTSVTTTGTQINYLNAATGTTGTTSTSVVYSGSPALTGSPTAPTQSAGDNSTKIATTAYIDVTYGPQNTSTASYTTSVAVTSSVASQMSTVTYTMTAQASALLFAAPTGSWTDGQLLIIVMTSDATPRALTYNAAFHAGTPAAPTTTIASKKMIMAWRYSSSGGAHFDLIGYADNLTP